MRVPTILIATMGLALVAGCGGGEKDSRSDDGSGPDPPALAGPLVYGRGGGFAGSSNLVRLRPDGRATFATEGVGERAAKLQPAELEKVERALARVDLAELPARFVASESESGPDRFVHEVTYQGETVYSEDADDDVPDDLSVLTSTLSALFERHAPPRRR